MTPLLSNEQRQALHESGVPLEVRDAESNEVFYLVSAAEIDRWRFAFTGHRSPPLSADEWKTRLRKLATRCGVSLSNEAVSSEGLYD